MAAHGRERVRTLIVWEIPAVGSPGFVEMYINPDNIQIRDQKLQTPVRTKGGFVLQYWGEALTQLTISGQTGDGGIEALNVLRDIYRSEQLALQKILQSTGSKRRQSLAQLAASVVMWYQGQGFRGFFNDFSYTETATELGSFRYNISFTATEVIGQRSNYLPWHKKPWSTLSKVVSPDGQGSTTGGAYGTRFKTGELNAPPRDNVGILRDPAFTSRTGIDFPQGTVQGDRLRQNFDENSTPLRPSDLFANV